MLRLGETKMKTMGSRLTELNLMRERYMQTSHDKLCGMQRWRWQGSSPGRTPRLQTCHFDLIRFVLLNSVTFKVINFINIMTLILTQIISTFKSSLKEAPLKLPTEQRKTFQLRERKNLLLKIQFFPWLC